MLLHALVWMSGNFRNRKAFGLTSILRRSIDCQKYVFLNQEMRGQVLILNLISVFYELPKFQIDSDSGLEVTAF